MDKNPVKPSLGIVAFCVILGVILAAVLLDLPAWAEPPESSPHKTFISTGLNTGTEIWLSDGGDIKERKFEAAPTSHVGLPAAPERSRDQRPSQAAVTQQGIYGQVMILT